MRITAHHRTVVGACLATVLTLVLAGSANADPPELLAKLLDDPGAEAPAPGALSADKMSLILRGHTLMRLHEQADYAADFAAWDGPPLKERIKSALSYHMPVTMGQNKMVFTVRARPKLRRLLELKLRF